MKKTFSHFCLTALCALFLAACATTGTPQTTVSVNEFDHYYGDNMPAAVLTELRVADKLGQGSNIDAALGIYEHLADENPHLVTPIVRQAMVYTKQKNYEPAENLFKKALGKRPDNLLLSLHYSQFLEAHKPQKVLPFWEENAAKLNHPRAYHKLGVAYDLNGKQEDALKAYDQGLRLSPRDAFLRNNKALSLAAQGKYNEAESLLAGLSNDFPKDPLYVSNRIIVLILADKIDDARALGKDHKRISEARVNTLISAFNKKQDDKPVTLLKRIATFQDLRS